MKSRFLFAALFALMPLSATAADYTVTFGEVIGGSTAPAPKTIAQTTNLKMCLEPYRFGYQVTPNVSGPYQLKMILHLPTAAKTVGVGIQALNYGHDLATDEGTKSGAFLQDFNFSEGDPLGTWSMDVIINNVIASTVSFNVVAASSCP
jgi:hypothetical protein